MNTRDLYQITRLSDEKSIESITSGGFVIPGESINAAVQTEEDLHFVTVLEIPPGQSKGNHYHKEKLEHIIILQGNVTVKLQKVEEGELVVEKLAPGSKISIKPGCAHVFIAGEEAVQFLEVTSSKVNPDDILAYTFA